MRYHAVTKSMPHNKLQVFCTVDYDSDMTLIGLHGPPGAEDVVGVARYMTDAEKQSAEVAFAVSDARQRKGLGTYFFNSLVRCARQYDIHIFHAYVLVQNRGMLKIFHGSRLIVEMKTEEGVVCVTIKVPKEGPGDPNRVWLDG